MPFHPLDKPLAKCRLTITTAAPYQRGKDNQGLGAPYNSAAKFYTVYSANTADGYDLRISHVAIDRKHTTAEDRNLLPTDRTASNGGQWPDWICWPTFSWSADQSQSSRDAQCRLSGDRRPVQGRQSRCRDPRSQLPSLPPECQPSRANAGGERFSTVIMGCAKDIVEYVGVPRFLFSDFPLGNAAGRPRDRVSQAFTLDLALDFTGRILER